MPVDAVTETETDAQAEQQSEGAQRGNGEKGEGQTGAWD